MKIISIKTKRYFLVFSLLLVSFFICINNSQAAGDGRIRFSWNPNTDDAVKYRLYHGVVSGLYGESFEIATTTVIFDASSFLACEHYFVVAAVDASENESGYSEQIKINRCESGCGNGLVETWLSVPEVCDGDSIACVAANDYPGTRRCNLACSGYETACTTAKYCGDGSVDGLETCDGGGDTQVSCVLGLYTGLASCSYDCRLGNCMIGNKKCGNGIKEDAEDCDPVSGTETRACTVSGFSGTQSCGSGTSSGCTWGACKKQAVCGDKVLDSGEDCDGSAFKNNNTSCQYWTGNTKMNGLARCSSDCQVNTNNCVLCGDGEMSSSESCEFVNGVAIYRDNQSTCQALFGPNSIGTINCNQNSCQRESNCYELIVGACGANDNGQFASLSVGTAGNCNPGTVVGFTTTATGWSWTCAGSNGGASSKQCLARHIISGTCGSSHNAVTFSTPVTNLCDASTSFILANPSYNASVGLYNWICKGNNNGTEISCRAPKCGDSQIVSPETCDNGSTTPDQPCVPAYNQNCNYCGLNCQKKTVNPIEYCGDGKINGGEICDDGADNGRPGGYCNTWCDGKSPRCGDGRLDSGESCDCGDDENGTGATACGLGLSSLQSCSSSCQIENPPSGCGDGVLDTNLGETCDCGARNGQNIASCGPGSDAYHYCSGVCQQIDIDNCGDAVINVGEVCDCGDSSTNASIPNTAECGLGNRRNGVQGAPGYGETLQYCSNDCQNIQSTIGAKCGDGTAQLSLNKVAGFVSYFPFDKEFNYDYPATNDSTRVFDGNGHGYCVQKNPGDSHVYILSSFVLNSKALSGTLMDGVDCYLDNGGGFSPFIDGVYSISFRGVSGEWWMNPSTFLSIDSVGLLNISVSMSSSYLLFASAASAGTGVYTITSDGANTKLYINGALYGTVSGVRMGRSFNITLNNNEVDDLFVWDKALSATEASLLNWNLKTPIYELCDGLNSLGTTNCYVNGYLGTLGCFDCFKNCQSGFCGDGIKSAGEACDPALSSGTCTGTNGRQGTYKCRSDCSGIESCQVSECGDGHIDASYETCDNGSSNTNTPCVLGSGQTSCTYCTTSCETKTVEEYNSNCGAMTNSTCTNYDTTGTVSRTSSSAAECLAWCQTYPGTYCCDYTVSTQECRSITKTNNSPPYIVPDISHRSTICNSTSVCGNNRTEAGENCDGNLSTYSYCRSDCLAFVYGNANWEIAPMSSRRESYVNQTCLDQAQLKWFCPARPCLGEVSDRYFQYGIIVHEQDSCSPYFLRTICRTSNGTGQIANVICREGVRWTDKCLMSNDSPYLPVGCSDFQNTY